MPVPFTWRSEIGNKRMITFRVLLLHPVKKNAKFFLI